MLALRQSSTPNCSLSLSRVVFELGVLFLPRLRPTAAVPSDVVLDNSMWSIPCVLLLLRVRLERVRVHVRVSWLGLCHANAELKLGLSCLQLFLV